MIAALLGAALFSPALEWRLSLGDQWSYRLQQTFKPRENPAPEDSQVFVYEGTIRVAGLKNDEIDFTIQSRLVKQRSGGEDLPLPDGPGVAATQTFQRNGGRLFEPDRYASEDEFRLSRLLWFAFPSEFEGDAWKRTWPKLPAPWAGEAQVAYRGLGTGRRLNRVVQQFSVHYIEAGLPQPMAAEGKAEVDSASGVLMMMDLTATDARVPGGEGRYTLQLSYEVTSMKLKGL